MSDKILSDLLHSSKREAERAWIEERSTWAKKHIGHDGEVGFRTHIQDNWRTAGFSVSIAGKIDGIPDAYLQLAYQAPNPDTNPMLLTFVAVARLARNYQDLEKELEDAKRKIADLQSRAQSNALDSPNARDPGSS